VIRVIKEILVQLDLKVTKGTMVSAGMVKLDQIVVGFLVNNS
jgi:hypothetical protein